MTIEKRLRKRPAASLSRKGPRTRRGARSPVTQGVTGGGPNGYGIVRATRFAR
ncbi:hypothetical protein [Burkholderia thailandensis]|uniref:hypothetical protein n=1 Tax=Burkholderia thailandensis TaxID=57975 RepID=UPI00016AA2C9|nr:hypothetical protein [Burkholderia thailandensis]